MKLEEITKIAELMSANDLAELAIESPEVKISMKRGAVGTHVVTVAAPAPVAVAAAPAPAAVAAAPVAAVEAASGKKAEYISSPIVGTFYASPSPDAPAFVKVGSTVKEDTVVCIVEAMKVMNEIKAEIAGKVVEVVAESGKPVQFGQVLFRVS